MRELARIQIRGDAAAFENAWNARYAWIGPKIMYGMVAIHKDEPAYERMRQLFADFATEHNMTWFERVHVEYSDQELAFFELLTLHVTGNAGEGNNAFAAVYLAEPRCDTCGRVEHRQVRNLVVDLLAVEADPYEIGYFQHDLCETRFHEVLVSDKVKSLLEEHQVPGIALRPVEHISADVVIPRPYYQLLIEPEIGPLIEPSPIERLDLCETCGQYKQVFLTALPGEKGSEFYFPRSSYTGEWLMRTTDQFGRVPNLSSELIISQKLYRLLKEHHVTGFWVQPAHLID